MLPKLLACEEVKTGRLVQVIDEYTGPKKGIYFVYAGRRQKAAAVAAFVDFAWNELKKVPLGITRGLGLIFITPL